jgi:hypothetical protein
MNLLGLALVSPSIGFEKCATNEVVTNLGISVVRILRELSLIMDWQTARDILVLILVSRQLGANI